MPNFSKPDPLSLFQASGAIILSRARNKGKGAKVNTKDEITSNLHVNDVEAEQKKYNNFWEGIQRRVALQQTHSKANDFMAVIKSATKKTKVFLSLYKYYKIERIKFSHYTTTLLSIYCTYCSSNTRRS